MANPHEAHFEPYLHLAGVTAEAALIAWGGFWFEEGPDGQLRLVDDEGLERFDPGRTESIGAQSEPYGEAVVEILGPDGSVVARATTDRVNHAWLDGLQADTEYAYRVVVDGRDWAEGPRRDWDPEAAGLGAPSRSYDCRFRTRPRADDPMPVTFLVIGDFGFGVRTMEAASCRQRAVAAAMEVAVERLEPRLVLTVGDNIYLGEDEADGDGPMTDDTGAEDDDWFFSIYQPYRYLLNRIPWYPVIGNHDAGETEQSDDRDQVNDNFFLDRRFDSDVESGRSSVDPGLCYSFDVGALVDFVAVDTTQASDEEYDRYFRHPDHRRFLEEELPDRGGQTDIRPAWHVPLSHHPAFCAGPSHENDQAIIDDLLPLYRRAGVRVALAGHEHNFQWSEVDGLHLFVTGSGAKLRDERPGGMAAAHTRAWAAEAHFLACTLTEDRFQVTPFRGLGPGESDLEELTIVDPDGEPVRVPIVIDRAGEVAGP